MSSTEDDPANDSVLEGDAESRIARLREAIALAESPAQQAVAKQIFRAMSAGTDPESDKIKGLVKKMAITIARERHGVEPPPDLDERFETLERRDQEEPGEDEEEGEFQEARQVDEEEPHGSGQEDDSPNAAEPAHEKKVSVEDGEDGGEDARTKPHEPVRPDLTPWDDDDEYMVDTVFED